MPAGAPEDILCKVGASRSMESICLISISEPADSASETVYNSSRDSINEIEELE